MSINLSALMKQRYDTAANWTAQNPTLLAGEIGIESDTKKWKVGTGATAWTSLAYAIGGTYPIVNADIAAGAEIAVSKLADGSARQLLQTDAAGTGVEWTSDVSIPGVLAVTAGTAALPGIAVSGDTNTGIYSPGADQLAIATGGTERLRITSAGNVGIGTTSPSSVFHARLPGTSTASIATFDRSDAAVSSEIHYDGSDGRISFGTTTNHPLSFKTNNTRAVTIDSSQRVGIGTTSPGFLLDVAGQARFGASPGALYFGVGNAFAVGQGELYSTGTASIGIGTGGSASLNLYTNSAERARIDSSGRLLVGTSTSRSWSDISSQFQIENVGTGLYASQSIIANSPDTVGGLLVLGKSRGTSLGSHTAVQNNDLLGRIYFYGADGSQLVQGAVIESWVDGTPGTNDMPGRLVFSTTADGAASPTERMRISADGSVSIATNSQPSTTNFGTFFGRTNLPGLIESFRNTNAAGTAAQFGGNLGYAQVMGDGDLENTNARYTGISDIKFKQNIEDASSQWDDIKAIQVRKYELIANPDRKHIGVIAQELEQTSPGLVIDREDLNGESYKSVAYSVLYMKAVKALQEAMERIETLEARLTALEGA